MTSLHQLLYDFWPLRQFQVIPLINSGQSISVLEIENFSEPDDGDITTRHISTIGTRVLSDYTSPAPLKEIHIGSL